MYKILFLFLLLCSDICAESVPTMRALLFLYTNDKKIGTGVVEDGKLMRSLLHSVSHNLDMPVVVRTMQGDEADVRKVNEWIDSVPKEDIAFVYMSGHGCNSKKSRWPFFFGIKDYYVDVGDIAAYMKNKHRADFVIADCCNAIHKDSSHYMKKPSSSWATISKSCAKALFLDFRGIVKASSSSPGQFSFTGDFGSAFTLCFLCTLEESKARSWDDVMCDSKKLCKEKTKKQSPIYSITRY